MPFENHPPGERAPVRPSPSAAADSTAPAPATGTTSPAATELPPEEQPVVTGTLFLMMIFLMMVAGFWALMYVLLLNR